jgi:hypothetical protein
MMHGPTMGHLAALILVALLGSSVAAESTPPEQATPMPSTGLASRVPPDLGGIPVTSTTVLSGPEVLAPESFIQLATWPAVLDMLDRDPEDLEVAYATYEDRASGASVVLVALRVDGISAAVQNLADAQAAAAARGVDDPFRTAVYVVVEGAQLVGSRLVWVQPGSDDRTRWSITYPVDDVLYWLTGGAVPMSQVLAALPEGGPTDAESQTPEE